MGRQWIPHSDLCGCEQCAAQADSENPRQVFDVVPSDDHYLCGCSIADGCECDWD